MKTLSARPLLAAILAVTLVGGPISPAFGQEAPQTPQAAPAKTAAPIVPVALGSAKHNYTRGPKFFPNLLTPYSPISIEAAGLTNSPRIDQLIHDGKLELSMQEAVELALENSMDIVVQPFRAIFDIRRVPATVAQRIRAFRQHAKHPYRQEQPQNRGLGLHPAGHHYRDQYDHRLLGIGLRQGKRKSPGAGRDRGAKAL